MSGVTTIMRIADGNPGALSVLAKLAVQRDRIALTDYLAEHGPHGSELWMLYKDVHGMDVEKLATDLRARMAER